MSPMVLSLTMIAFFGAVGGVVNALMTEGTVAMPKTSQVGKRGPLVIQVGILGNALISATAAIVSWGLYAQSTELSNVPVQIAGAIMVGMGGARILTNELDKRHLTHAAGAAAAADANHEAAKRIKTARPAKALEIAQGLLEG